MSEAAYKEAEQNQASDDEGGIYEYFYSEYPPPEKGSKNSGPKATAPVADPTESDKLY